MSPGSACFVTGASGGVGRFAVQLAAQAGASVIASVGSNARGAGLAGAGATEVTVGLSGVEREIDVVLETVGGSQLVQAWQLLAPGGNLQSIGWASGERAVFPPYSTIGTAKSLNSYNTGPFDEDLATLARLVAEGTLKPEIGWRGPIERIAEAFEMLRERRVQGKVVLDVHR
jgi:NADPH:quinone reductase